MDDLEDEKICEEQLRLAVSLLEAKGVILTVDGCGCCGSPLVKLTIDGVDVVHDTKAGADSKLREFFCIDMHGEGDD